MHEDFDIDAFAVRVQRVGHHLANWNLAVVDRGTDVQRAEVSGVQGKALARFAVGDRRWVLQSFEGFCPSVGLANVGADVVARQQRIDARNTAGADAGAHHPELRILAGEGFGLLGQFDRGVDVSMIVGQFDLGDVADDHVAVPDFGLVGGQAIAGLESDGDRRAFLEDVVNDQRNAHQHRHDRHNPYQ